MRISDWSSDVCSSDLGLDFRWGPKLYRKLLRQPGGRERIKHYLQHYQPELGAETAEVEQNLDAWVAKVHTLKSHYFKRYMRRSEEHTSELQSLMRISYAVFCLKKKNKSQYKYHE